MRSLPFALTAAFVTALAACTPAPSPTPPVRIGVTVFPTPTLAATATPQPSPTPAPTSTPAPMPTPARPEQMRTAMSLEHKVGQLMMVTFPGAEAGPEMQALIADLGLGAVALLEPNIAAPAQLAALSRGIQAAALAGGHPQLFISVDHEGGPVTRFTQAKGFTEFPTMMGIAATGDVENARRAGQAMARELRAVGVNMNLAPVVDVNTNPANPIIGTRAFGSRPDEVTRFGAAFAGGMQAEGVLAVAKHFPGHGSTGEDSHDVLPIVQRDRATLDAVDLVPFRALADAGVAGIMGSHVWFTAFDPAQRTPATLSPAIWTDLLRGELRYEGLALTDSLEMGALASNGWDLPSAAIAALRSGADVLVMSSDFGTYRAVHAALVEAVRSGAIPLSRLDDAVRRVLRAKERFGVLDAAPPDPARAPQAVGTAEARGTARQLIDQSITLARDEGGRLPLPAGAPLLVIETPYAYGLSGSLGWPGLRVSEQTTPDEIARAVALAQGRAALVTTSDALRNPGQADLVRALAAAGVPVIAWAVRSPYDLAALKDVPALTVIATYGTPPYLLIEPIQALLAGAQAAPGKLPVDLP